MPSYDLKALIRSKTPRRKTIILRPIDPSRAVELDLLHALNKLVSKIVSAALEFVAPAAAEQSRRFQRDDVGANARSIIELLRKDAERAEAQAQVTASEAISREGTRHTRKWTAGVGSSAQIDLGLLLRDDDLVDLLSVRSEEFNRLIRNLSNDVLDRIERQTLGAIFEGRGQSDIAKSLQEVAGIGRNRARLIARDQAAKLNGAMNQFRQEQAGITHYRWRTIMDGRERPEHHARDKKIFAWTRPPIDGHPGHAINCRCRALAIITDDPEDLVTGQGDPLPDWYEENLPLVRSVAPTAHQDVGAMTSQVTAERLAQTRELAGKVSALRSLKSFTEADAERLVIELYGLKPSDDDLKGLLTGLQKITASRRTILIEAARAQVDLIERTLIRAGFTPKGAATPFVPPVPKPQPVTSSPPQKARQARSVPKAAAPKALPMGKYAERLAGGPRPLTEAVEQSRRFVRYEGNRTGNEWAIAHDETGADLARMSSGKTSFVNVDPKLLPEIYSPRYRVTFHHNHPSGTSFSIADLDAFVTMPGLDVLYAHGANRSLYRVVVLDRPKISAAAKAANTIVRDALVSAHQRGEITESAANALYAHIRTLILHRRGLLEYQFELAGPPRQLAENYAHVIEKIIDDAARHPLN